MPELTINLSDELYQRLLSASPPLDADGICSSALDEAQRLTIVDRRQVKTITLTISDELHARLLSLSPPVDLDAAAASALTEWLDRRHAVKTEQQEPKRGQGRPAPPVPKSKKSLYLDEQVWTALDKESKRQNPEEGISATACPASPPSVSIPKCLSPMGSPISSWTSCLCSSMARPMDPKPIGRAPGPPSGSGKP